MATPSSTVRPGRSTSTNPSSAWRPRPPVTATGWWRPTAASSPMATPSSTARPGRSTSTNPSSAWRPRPDRPRLLAGGGRRRHLRLWRRPVLRLDRVDPPQPTHRRHGGHSRRSRATGWWRPTAASSPWRRPVLRVDRVDPPQPTHRRHGGRYGHRRLLVCSVRWGHILFFRTIPRVSGRTSWSPYASLLGRLHGYAAPSGSAPKHGCDGGCHIRGPGCSGSGDCRLPTRSGHLHGTHRWQRECLDLLRHRGDCQHDGGHRIDRLSDLCDKFHTHGGRSSLTTGEAPLETATPRA